jgi:hypothetical protein
MNNTTVLQNRSKWALAFMLFTAVTGWFGLITQLYITLSTYQSNRTLAGVLVQYISYFTIICNALVTVSLTVIIIKPNSVWGRFFSRSTVLTALTLYIIIVGIVYNIALRGLVGLDGPAFWANEIIHVIIPVLFAIFWLTIVPKIGLSFKSILPWLWLPFIYLIYILLRGAISGLYPYPFMDARKFGYHHIAIRCFLVMLAFLTVSVFLVFIDRRMAKK